MRWLILLSVLLFNACSSESTDEVQVIQKFTLIVNSSDGGSVNTVGGQYTKGSTVTVTATPNEGYTFSGWTGNSNSTEPTITLVMDGNISITASFTQIINKSEKTSNKKKFIENRSFVVKNINDFFLYNLSQNTLLNSLEDSF